MIIRPLRREEIEAIWTIDRSEVHQHVYRLHDGALVRTPAYFDLRGWPPEQVEQDTPSLYACFDRGGAFIGAFDEGQHDQLSSRLIGVAVVDSAPLGPERDQRQLKYLYVSRSHRQHGVGTRLFDEARAIARARGAAFLYVSATPTENTVNFYLRRGCRSASTPNPDLLDREPDDIHLICPV